MSFIIKEGNGKRQLQINERSSRNWDLTSKYFKNNLAVMYRDPNPQDIPQKLFKKCLNPPTPRKFKVLFWTVLP